MHRIVTVAAASLALAACGGSSADADGDGEITMEEAAAKSADMVRPQPGKYRATVEFVDVSMPDAPQQVQDMMRGMFDRGPQTHEYCLTKEEADKGFEEMARQAQDNDTNCSFEKFDAAGGQIDAIMNCCTDDHDRHGQRNLVRNDDDHGCRRAERSDDENDHEKLAGTHRRLRRLNDRMKFGSH